MRKQKMSGKRGTQAEISNIGHPRKMGQEFVHGETITRDSVKYVEGESLVNMIKEDLATQRIAVDCCRVIIQYLGDQDPNTRHMLEDVLAVQGERAGELANRPKP